MFSRLYISAAVTPVMPACASASFLRRVPESHLAVMVFPILLIMGVGGHPVLGQTYVDDDGTVEVTGSGVDCDGNGTAVPTSIEEALANKADDINVCGGTYTPSTAPLEVKSQTTVVGVEGSGDVRIEFDAPGSVPFELSGSRTSLQRLTIAHTGQGPSDATPTVKVKGGSRITLSDLTVRRTKLMNTTAAIEAGGSNLTITNCDISGGPIADGAGGTYRVEDNTIRGAGNEGIWMKGVDEAILRNNTIARTSDGDPQDDRMGIAVYGATTSLVLENNTIKADEAPLLLGDDIPIKHEGTTSPLETASDLRALLGRNTINGRSPGKVTFVAQSDGTLRANNEGLHIIRTGLTNVPGSGGAAGYNKSALDIAQAGDLIHLTPGATYNESVTITKNLGLSVPGAASIQSFTIGDGRALTLDGSLTFTNGLTASSGSSLDGDTAILGTGATFTDRGLVSGALKATRDVAAGETTNFGNIGLTLSDQGGANSPGRTTVTRVDGQPVTEGNGSIERYYDVEAENSTNLKVDLTLEYDDGTNGDNELDASGVSESALAIFHSDDGGASWAELPVATADQSANTITTEEVTSFSRFTAAESGSSLPVELAAFSAVAEDGVVVLRWATASETNNAGFRVQRRTETGFETLAFVDGAGTVSEQTRYQYRITDLSYGPHTFRLQQVDQDGTTHVSDSVRVRLSMETAYEVSPVTPNPVAGQAQVDVTVKETQEVTVAVYDPLGRRVRTLHAGRLTGGSTRHFTIDGQALSSGTYFVRVRGERLQTMRRFVVVR